MLKPGVLRVTGTRSAAFGVEAARIVTDGQQVIAVEATGFRAFDAVPGEDSVGALELTHAEAVAALGPVDLVGFDGAPGSGQVLAEGLGLPVVWDFSSADRQLGGLGHPIEAFYFHALARHLGFAAPVAFFVLDQVATLVWCDPRVPDAQGGCMAFDTGPAMPGPGPMGQVDGAALDAFAQSAFAHRLPPKSFDLAGLPDLGALSLEDQRATQAALCATGLALAMQHCPAPPTRLIVAGEGRLDAGYMGLLAAAVDLPPEPLDALGVTANAVLAQAIAFVAVRVARGLPTSAPMTTGVAAPVGGGTLSRP